MLLPQTKEREYRFKLALRMGLPIFALIIALISHTLVGNYATLQTSFYIESLILLVFSIYFILYLIYSGFEVKITDDVSKTFTREYLYKYITAELEKKQDYTLILISIDNLNDINSQYGIKNGDRVLQEVATWIASYFLSQKIENFPMGHIKGGDFIVGLRGKKSDFATILELMCLKSSEFKVENIEIKISGAISDTSYSRELDYIIENLFELQEETRNSKNSRDEELLNPSERDLFVINAIHKRLLSIMTQDVFSQGKVAFKECYITLKTSSGKPLFTKSYMKVINRLGLRLEYDMMIIEELLLRANKEDTYAINIAPSSLRDKDFLVKIKELLKQKRTKLMFILSESEYYSHTSRYNTILNSLRSLGVLITIDRVGAIQTSFLYLRELNIDFIRFDTYYSNREKIVQNRAILEGFHLMAKQKGIKTWIKNIETEECLALCKELNIECLEGKLLADLKIMYEK